MLYFITLCLFLQYTKAQSPLIDEPASPAFDFITHDSVIVNVYKTIDTLGLPHYKALLTTPICEDEQCYEVKLLLYWDAIGKFQKFDTLPSNPLTKFEHKPFTTSDYTKLHDLLKLNRPAFHEMEKKDLITKVDDNSVDATSGATVLAVKDETVSGAAYSCFVLWHVTHGNVRDQIKTHTSQHITPSLINYLLKNNSIESNYYLLNNFKEADFLNYQSALLTMIDMQLGYFPKKAIEALPKKLLLEFNFQDSLAARFSSLDYYAQMSLIKRLKDIPVTVSLSKSLINNMSARTQGRNQLIINIICATPHSIDDETILLLKNTLQEKENKRAQ